jgi:Autotransporter beta-domain
MRIVEKHLAALAICAAFAAPAKAAETLIGANLQQRTDAILGLMGFSLTPDVTTGSLSFADVPTGNPDVKMSTLGGGFTMSQSLPLYLEGTAGWSRYDPEFLASDGQSQRQIPTKWNSLSLTAGVGWDFPVVKDLKFRPIFNFSYGRVASDSHVAGNILENQSGEELQFLQNGSVDVYGLGGSLMLDYERYRPENEIDVELRYSDIYLQSLSGAPPAVQGNSDARSLSLWSRWRAPTGLTALNRPVRYVLEAAQTVFLGDLRGALGFDDLTSLGVGLELDSSAHDIIITRTRVVFRYKFGHNVEGTSIGVAISF